MLTRHPACGSSSLLEVAPQRDDRRSDDCDQEHGLSPPGFQATCHPFGRLPPALTVS